jgi:hypothetical protein
MATVRPGYGESTLADVMPGALALLGLAGSPDPLGLATGRLAGVRTVVILLIDGLGHHLLPLAAPFTPTLADLTAGRIEGTTAGSITTGFPSTTPTSLASLTTGAPPGAHGIVGFLVNIPGTDWILNHIHWHGEPDPSRWQPLPTGFELARAAGVATYVVSRPDYQDSGLTRAIFRGADYVAAPDLDTLAAGILHVASEATRPTLVYGYHPDVDKAGHIHGLDSPQWRVEVADVDRLLTRLIEQLPPDAALLVTADHGQVNVPAEHRFDLAVDPRLRAGVRVVAGESRVRYLHTVPGARDDVIAAWREILGEAAWVLSRDEAAAAGWFGPITEEHLYRVGDVVAACHGDYVVLANRIESSQVAAQVAFHGSATEVEMRIPLLLVRRP